MPLPGRLTQLIFLLSLHHTHTHKQDDLSGSITESELYTAFRDMGIDMKREELHEMVLDIDEDSDGEINFLEFSVMLYNLSIGKMNPRKGVNGLGGGGGDEQGNGQASETWLEIHFPNVHAVREGMWKTFEEPSSSRFAGFLSVFLMGLIVISVLFFILETLPVFYKDRDFKIVSKVVEDVCIAFFTLEYVRSFILTSLSL